MASPKELEQQIVKFAQLLLADAEAGSVDSLRIDAAIEQVLVMKPAWALGIDRTAVKDELIRRYSVWIGEDSTLKSDKGHVEWLSSKRKTGWRYWQRYREFLENSISESALDGLDRSTDKILGLLEDPRRQEAFDRRGLVVGHVQSGKTASYTGVICKAADAGYKIIIVLAGLHNNLRSQTQVRLDEGFLGYQTRANSNEFTSTGVGDVDKDPAIRPNSATNRSNTGDFSRSVADNLGISPEERPWLFVVKKNTRVLTLLLSWIRKRVANTNESGTGRPIVTNLPLLLIDDEADHASVDTGETVLDENGKPDSKHEPRAINRLIRTILHSFTHSAYVGYTATPFANIFIHERGATIKEGPDLFPASFIHNLAAPSSYVGPSKVFGSLQEDGSRTALPLSVRVSDYLDSGSLEGWMPPKHKSDHIPLWQGHDVLPPSVRQAVLAFVLSCAARDARGQGSKHCSMLIHVTRFTAVQGRVWKQVETYVTGIRQRLERNIDSHDILQELRLMWETDFLPKIEQVAVLSPEELPVIAPDWESISGRLAQVCQAISVRKINGTAKDILDYADNDSTGLKVIAIGGDKLARGLTLEGLTVSYFLRASKMYDTLMQMGRWFGYRPGYLDLCRLYTTGELIEWFGHIAEASEELRKDFDLMAQQDATPLDFGLRVKSHSSLIVTSRVKMRSAKNLMISFSGELVETVTFRNDPQIVNRNFQALQTLISQLSGANVDPSRVRKNGKDQWQGYLWNDVDSSLVTSFLRGYETDPSAYRVNTQMLSQFIGKITGDGELGHWTVALIGSRDASVRTPVTDDVGVGMLVRADRSVPSRYSIGRLLSPRDESIDLDDKSWEAALALSISAFKPDPARGRINPPEIPSGPAIRYVRGFGSEDGTVIGRNNGLLLLYLLDPVKSDAPMEPGSSPIVAFGLSFPGSKAGTKVEYKVNNVLWEQEFGQSE